ncbi:MAG: ABC transporter ATP-binding protein [Bacteroidales bacterium]|nr:ABC transporter ATP-binding protein [Bacteroidales bacterium]
MLEIKNISIRLGDFSLNNVSLTVNRGDYLTLLGVSGAGKTVLLEVLAGLVKPLEGKILWNGVDITDQKIQKRPVGLVYQDLSLFPHLTVEQNIAFPLKCKKLKKHEISAEVAELAETTGVAHLLKRFPGTLSGGEAQRVALARTLASEPEILLLDEPLANLDITIRSGLSKLLRMINRGGKTVIHVTHDFTEAATLGNKVAVIENGKLAQSGDTREVFLHPASAFVARFGGMKNLFHCRVFSNNSDPGLKTAKIGHNCQVYFTNDTDLTDGYISIPAEDIILSDSAFQTSAINQFQGVITETWMSGAGMEVVIDSGAEFVVTVSRTSFEKMQLEPGKKIWLTFKASAVKFLNH